jgi:prepilin-type N-terminal cleavage/methylation domain-containing protein
MRARAGMTLLELTVALSVGGAALAAGGAAVTMMLDRRAALLADAEVDSRALAARRLLIAWVSEMRVGSGLEGGLVGRRGTRRTPDGQLADDSVAFLTAADGEWRHVQVHVDHSAQRPALVAEVTFAGGAPARITLAADVAGFEATYLTSAFGRRDARREWNGALLPTAVVLRLQAAGGVVLPAPLRLPITIPLANPQ